VEDEFVRRRGSHLMISPIDWALVEAWRAAGIPLHIVLRGINKAFDSYESGSPKFRKVNSVLYCQQAVEEAFSEWTLTQVGSAADDTKSLDQPEDASSSPGFTLIETLQFLQRVDRDLQALETDSESVLKRAKAELSSADTAASNHTLLAEAIRRTRDRLSELTKDLQKTERLNPEALERDLDSLDRLLLNEIKAACGDELLSRYRKEAKSELRTYRSKMEKDIYNQTVENFVARRLRESFGIPRLSLLYF